MAKRPKVPKSLTIDEQFILQAADLTRREAKLLARYHRVLVDARKAIKSTSDHLGSPPELFRQVRLSTHRTEKQVNMALQIYADQHAPTRWMRECALGIEQAVLLYTLIEHDRLTTVSGLWRFIGYDPNVRRYSKREAWDLMQFLKGKYGTDMVDKETLQKVAVDADRRVAFMCRLAQPPFSWGKLYYILQAFPWNKELKELCYRVGITFRRPNPRGPSCPYTELYRQRKLYEEGRNEAGNYEGIARDVMRKFNYGQHTQSFQYYAKGKLSPAHLDARARRHTVKIFLAHLFEVMYYERHGSSPPRAYVIDVLKKDNYVSCPKWPYRVKAGDGVSVDRSHNKVDEPQSDAS